MYRVALVHTTLGVGFYFERSSLLLCQGAMSNQSELDLEGRIPEVDETVPGVEVQS